MKIVVCIKPIRSNLVYTDYSGENKFQINPYDLNALEEVISLKKKCDCKIITISMGPPDAKEVITRSLAIGADEGILLSDKSFAGSDTVATSYILSQAIKKIGSVDLVVCGLKSLDGETGQVTHSIGKRLGLDYVSSAESIKDVLDDSLILCQRKNNKVITYRLGFPSLIYFQDFKLRSEKISLLAIKRARKKVVTLWNAKDIDTEEGRCGIDGSKTKVMDIKSELLKKTGTVIQGDVKEKAYFIKELIVNERWS